MQTRSFATHDGPFHADEVTACALLLIFDLIDRTRIVRTRDPKIMEECEYVCDVGGVYDPAAKRFDHHQVEYEGELSSAGLVCAYLFNTGVIDEGIYRHLTNSLILGVDAIDNGLATLPLGHASFSSVIALYVPPAYEAGEALMRQGFFDAIDFTIGHLKRLLTRYEYVQSCQEIVKGAMAKQEPLLFFDAPLPWMDNFFDLGGESHPALFVVMPAGAHWKLRTVPPSAKLKMQMRKPLPKAWAGLLDASLQEVSKIPGAIFCHKRRFISIWKTKEDALAAFRIAMEMPV